MEDNKIPINEEKEEDKESDIIPKKKKFPKRLVNISKELENKKAKKKS